MKSWTKNNSNTQTPGISGFNIGQPQAVSDRVTFHYTWLLLGRVCFQEHRAFHYFRGNCVNVGLTPGDAIMKSHINPDDALRSPADWTRRAFCHPNKSRKTAQLIQRLNPIWGLGWKGTRMNERTFFLFMVSESYFKFLAPSYLLSCCRFSIQLSRNNAAILYQA